MKLNVENLHKSYQSKIVIDHISFEINNTETVGLLGPNGAGKTTLFYMIAGLIKPEAGKISISGKDLSNLSVSERT